VSDIQIQQDHDYFHNNRVEWDVIFMRAAYQRLEALAESRRLEIEAYRAVPYLDRTKELMARLEAARADALKEVIAEIENDVNITTAFEALGVLRLHVE